MSTMPTPDSSFPVLRLTGRSLRNVFALTPAFLIATALTVMFMLSPEHGPAGLSGIISALAALLFLWMILRALRPKTLIISEGGVRYAWEKEVKFELRWNDIKGIFFYQMDIVSGNSAKVLAFAKGHDLYTVKEGEIKGSDVDRAFAHLERIAPQLPSPPTVARCEHEQQVRELMRGG